jgi:hypothetical protein
MQKKTPDYDNVFKTLKYKHKRLFVPAINKAFKKDYPLNVKVEILPTEGYLTENETADGSKEIEEKDNDFLIRIGNDVYLLECQSYDDGSMAIRIVEYAFLAARQTAQWDMGYAKITMPNFSIIYVKRTDKTPKKTTIEISFPNGEQVTYESDNVILEEFTKEYIVENRLFPYIPFYIARYEKELAAEGNVDTSRIDDAVNDLEYFRDEMNHLHVAGELSDDEFIDLKGLINTIITHITNGNKNEGRLVKVMGGVVLETETEKIRRIERTTDRTKTVKNMISKGKTPEEIADLCGYDLNFVNQVAESLTQSVH